MSAKSRGLGRGLDALFDTQENVVESEIQKDAQQIAVLDIDPNPDQPRRTFDKEKLNDLSNSIKEHGVLQPILLVKHGSRYRIVAGERRWRASRLAGLTHVPALVKDLTQQEIAEVTLIENLQRDDLNPMEEALGIRTLMDEFGLTQEVVANRLGKSRPAVANTLRLLNLPKGIAQHISEGRLSSGHGRALSSITNPEVQDRLCQKALDDHLSVRQLEQLVKNCNDDIADKPEKIKTKAEIPVEFDDFIQRFQKGLGSKVSIAGSLEKGKITISYKTREELERLNDIATRLSEK